jgi:hypothetical protein
MAHGGFLGFPRVRVASYHRARRVQGGCVPCFCISVDTR